MNLAYNIVINSYSIVLLIVILIHSQKGAKNNFFQHKLYINLVKLTILALVLDILGRFDGNPNTIYPVINHVANLFLFIVNPILPSFWFLYVHYQVYNDEEKTKRLFYPLCILNIINSGLIILSQFNGWIYYIDSNNIYHRGPHFLFSAILVIALLLASFVLVFKNQKKIEKKYFYSLIFFSIPPCIGTVLQLSIYGFSFVLNSIVLSLLIIHLNIQNYSIYTDYLTEISNREKFEAKLREKINASTENKTFSLIMLDFDNFKNINDTLGHEMGDRALKTAAELFKKCMRANDFIARIGGDEFCFILDISNKTKLEAAVDRINSCVDEYNKSYSQPYKLFFSMGYAVYDYHAHMKAEELFKQVDRLMYEDKKRKKHNKSFEASF